MPRSQVNPYPPPLQVAWRTPDPVANLAALAALPVGSYPDGTPCYVQSLRGYWILRSTGAPPIAMLRIVSADPLRVWERASYYERDLNPWATLAEIRVNALTGNDENSGVAGSPIQTLDELRFRTWLYAPAQPTRVVIEQSAPLENLVCRVYSTAANSFTVAGTTTELYRDTCLAWTNANRATPELNLLTATGLADWTPYVGRRLRVTTGAAAGAVGRIMCASPKGAGLNVARLSRIAVPGPFFWDTNMAPGDEFVIESLSTVGSTEFVIADPVDANGTTMGAMVLQDLWIASDWYQFANFGPAGWLSTQLLGCEFSGWGTSGFANWYGTGIRRNNHQVLLGMGQLGAMASWNVFTYGGVHDATADVLNCSDMGMFSFAVQATSMRFERSMVFGILADVAIFDSPAASMVVAGGDYVRLDDAVGPSLWGDGNALPVRVDPLSRLECLGFRPTISNLTGPGNDISVGGVVVAWGALPNVNLANLAAAVA